MKTIYERVINLAEKRRMEWLQAQMEKQAGILDYIAMMADVEIPSEEEEADVV